MGAVIAAALEAGQTPPPVATTTMVALNVRRTGNGS